MHLRTNPLFVTIWSLRWRVIASLIVICCGWLLATWLTPYRPQPDVQFADRVSRQTYVRAVVTDKNGSDGKVRILEGSQRGMVVPIASYGMDVRVGATILIQDGASSERPNSVTQPWRVPALILLVVVMVVAVICIGGRQGALSIVGLAVSVAVIAYYVIPTALSGGSALTASSIAAFVIATIAVMIAHSPRWRTLISLISIYIVVTCVIVLTLLSGWLVGLSGVYDETSSILSGAGRSGLDMYGILLGGIIIASLGVLDDVVTTQVAAVDELRAAKPHASLKELYVRGMSVGREHLSALINTLALAYVGVALPTILVMSRQASDGTQLLLTLNYEYIAIEITRTVISSLGIILAIPLSTALAVVLITKRQQLMRLARRALRKPAK